MPLYADFYAYGPTPVFSSTHYSALLYLGSSSSYTSRLGSFIPTSSRSPLPTPPRLLPPRVSRRPRRFAPPSLTTISESSGSPILSSSPRLRSHYTAPRPIRIDTADIDVTSPRNRGPFDRSSDGTGDRKGSPKERAGTIRRGRTVVRLHTRRLKDGPPPSALAAVAKTQGERLAEKFYIHDSPSRESPTRQKAKPDEWGASYREDCKRKGDTENVVVKEEEKKEVVRESAPKETDATNVEIEPKVTKDDVEEREKDEIYETKSKVAKVDKQETVKDRSEPEKNDSKVEDREKSPANFEEKVFDSVEIKSVVGEVKNEALSIVGSFESENASVVGKILSSSEDKEVRMPRLIVGDVSIEVCHLPRPPRPKPGKRLRMQVEVLMEGEVSNAATEKIKKIQKSAASTAKDSAAPKTAVAIHSVPSSPVSHASAQDKFATSKSAGDLPKLWTEEGSGAKPGESPKIGKGEKGLKAGDVREVGGRKSEGVHAPSPKKESAQVTEETPAIREKGAGAVVAGGGKGAAAKGEASTTKEATVSDRSPNAIEDSPSKRGTPSALLPKNVDVRNLKGSELQGLKKVAKQEIEPLKVAGIPKNEKSLEKSVVPESPKSSPESMVAGGNAVKLAVETVANKKLEKDSLLTNATKVLKPTGMTNEIKKDKAINAKVTKNGTDLQKQKKIIKELDIKVSPQPIEIKGLPSPGKAPESPLSVDTLKDQKTTTQIQKPKEAASTPRTIETNKKNEVTVKEKEINKVTETVPVAKTKIQTPVPIAKKERNSTDPIPLIIDEETYDQKNVKRSISSGDAEIPVKMIKVFWPQKLPIPKVIEKPLGLLPKLLESKKTEEPERKIDTKKITEIGETKGTAPGTVSAKSVVTGAPELTKVDGKKDEPKPLKQPNSQDTTSFCQKTTSPISPETPVKDKTQAVNKLAGIKTDFKKEPEPETPAAKTKRQPPITKISQELRKTGTAITTDLKVVNKEVTKEREENVISTDALVPKDSSATPKNNASKGTGEEKKPILPLTSAKGAKKAEVEPVTEVRTKAETQVKVGKTESPAKPNDRVVSKEIADVKKVKKVLSEKNVKDKVKTTQISKSKLVKEEPKKMEEVKTEVPVVPPIVGEEVKEEDSESEEDSEESEEETESETDTETEDEGERQLVEEAIRRASIPGTSAAPAKSLPRYRDYNVQDFLFLRVLGKGSFGKVFLAVLRDSDRHYAIKCLKKQSVIEEDDVECTLIERKVLSLATSHPYLCHLFCTFQTESHLFFVMEYLNGGDLMFHIQRTGRFEQERAQFYAAEIVSGLKFLHKKGIVYRDLKLDNLLLDYDGHVRIADFGMCKLQIFLDRTADTFCGTPDYIAPEIIKGYRYNQTVDWWSFGVLLYEMLVGQSPFTGCDEDELFWSICNENPLYPRFLTSEACDILARLLNKDSDRRLGAHGCPAGDVCDQPFFRPIDWGRLERKELVPPFRPALKHPLDLQYFETTFTCERAKLTPVNKQVLAPEDQLQFDGFSYTNPNATD